jgi:hypothetical protein
MPLSRQSPKAEGFTSSGDLGPNKTRLSLGPNGDPLAIVKARRTLYLRPYWNRAWIIQELYLAYEVLFRCGAYQKNGE